MISTQKLFFGHKPTGTRTLEIHPDLAKDMLATSPGNRALRPWHVTLLAGAMRRGEWRITSQGIGFDKLGRLRDGHHRLTACIQAGVTFQTVVVYGLPDDAFEVIDIGIKRTYADLLGEDRPIAEMLRLGCQFALGTALPSVDQMRPIIDSGFGDVAKSVVEHCPTSRKVFSSTPVRLAAAISIMNGERDDFVLHQYRALVLAHYDEQTPAAQSFSRIGQNIARISQRELLARAFWVFSEANSPLTRTRISDASKEAAVALVKSVLLGSVSAGLEMLSYSVSSEEGV